MSRPLPDANPPLDPAAAQLLIRVRRLMLISGAVTLMALALVFGIIGYRVSTGEGSGAPPDVTATLPQGARVIGTAVADGRIVVTIETGSGVELRSYDLKTLRPLGRLRFTTPP
jgi:hypothetical protein